jgi:hypothetical protein
MLSEITNSKLIYQKLNSPHTKEVLREEVGKRLIHCENETELQILWKFFKKLT